MIFVAKPLINNNKGLQEFPTVQKAVDYLNGLLPDDYPIMQAEDYFLIGKLYEKSGDTSWIVKPNKVGRPKKVSK